jgi:hypothetical protein
MADKPKTKGRKMSKDQQKLILEHEKIAIDQKTQQELNKPLEAPKVETSPEDRQFLEMILEKVAKKQIDLFTPSTLINHAVYDALPDDARGKADFDAVNLLATLREIKKLCDAGFRETYQTMYMVRQVRLTKERLEEISGDIYVI